MQVSKSSLSFAEDLDGDGAEEEVVVVKKRVAKNPSVNTSFLPDRERELQEIGARCPLFARGRRSCAGASCAGAVLSRRVVEGCARAHTHTHTDLAAPCQKSGSS